MPIPFVPQRDMKNLATSHMDGDAIVDGDVSTPFEMQRVMQKSVTNHLDGDAIWELSTSRERICKCRLGGTYSLYCRRRTQRRERVPHWCR